MGKITKGTWSEAELRAWRANLGLTQASAAEELGCSLRHYCNLELGKSPISQLVENSANQVSLRRASLAKKVDGRFRKPVDWDALGKPLHVWTHMGDDDGCVFQKSKDPQRRPRFKTLADALASDWCSHWAVIHSEERPDSLHVYLAGSEKFLPIAA